MKFTVEVDLDWMEEDGSLTESVQRQVIGKIEDRVSEEARKQITLAVADRLGTIVDDNLNDILQEWMSNKVEVTDQWGEVVHSGAILDMIKKKFDLFWNTKVDAQGRSGRDMYGDRATRVEWIISNSVEKHCKRFAKDMEERFTKEVEKQVSDTLKVAIGNRVVETLGMPELMENIRKQLPKKSDDSPVSESDLSF